MHYSDKIKHLILSDELIIAGKLIRYGLRELQSKNTYNDFIHLPILLLANGFERLLKIIICYKYYNKRGHFPTISEIKGHDIQPLLDKVTSECFTPKYLEIPAARQDLKFLQDDTLLKSIIKILSDFGDHDRYYNLDIVIGKHADSESPEDEWGKKLELAVINIHPNWAKELSKPNNDVLIKVANELVAIFERFARALGRLFTLGELSPEADINSTYLMDFITLSDSKLGSISYSECTT
jgi:hypothetical protein